MSQGLKKFHDLYSRAIDMSEKRRELSEKAETRKAQLEI